MSRILAIKGTEGEREVDYAAANPEHRKIISS